MRLAPTMWRSAVSGTACERQVFSARHQCCWKSTGWRSTGWRSTGWKMPSLVASLASQLTSSPWVVHSISSDARAGAALGASSMAGIRIPRPSQPARVRMAFAHASPGRLMMLANTTLQGVMYTQVHLAHACVCVFPAPHASHYFPPTRTISS
jgi:hypothetical protein